MAITGIDTIDGKQIIAAGAVSAKSAEMAYNDENGNPITGYQVAGDYYSASNPSGFISEVPDTYLQNTDLSTTDGKVTAISGIPLSAGGDVPEGVMVESGLEYNAVNEISGYNGSAIAQYGAEKQWLVHDDTLVHAANSAQYALGVNLSVVAQLLGVDETVLFENQSNSTASMVLSEPPSAFNYIKLYGYWMYNGSQCMTTYIEIPTNRDKFSMFGNGVGNLNAGTYNMFNCASDYEISGNTITVRKCIRKTDTDGLVSYDDGIIVSKVIGIGRKQ